MQEIHRNNIKKRSAYTGILLMGGVLTGISPAGSGAPPVDAGAWVRKMLRAYQTATTIRETTEARINQGNADFIQTGSLKFKSPNLFVINTQDPNSGTVSVTSDGKTISIFSGRSNVYTKRNGRPSLAETIETMGKATQDLTGGDVVQMLNPISFVLAPSSSLREAKTFRFVAQEPVNGRPAMKIAAQADTNWMRQILGDPKLSPVQRDILLWIDTRTSVLLKASVRISWKSEVIANGKRTQAVGTLSIEETHRDVILNAPFNTDDFRFIPPKGAKQVFQENRN